MSLKTLLGLIIANLIWSTHPTLGKFVLKDFSPMHFAFLRYGSALLAYLVFSFFLKTEKFIHFRNPEFRHKDLLLALSLGFFTFCYSPLFQCFGLSITRATDNALIIAMEPLITVFMAWVLLGEKLKPVYVVAFAFALLGFFLLTGLSSEQVLTSFSGPLLGNLLILCSLLGEGTFSSFSRKLLDRHSPFAVFGTSLTIGVCLLLMIVVFHSGLPPLHQMSLKSFLSILVLGPIGTTGGYLFWVVALRNAPIASLSLTLFIQPVFGTLWGYLFLNEILTPLQALGGVLILASVFFQTRK